jgi:hypothetical protein
MSFTAFATTKTKNYPNLLVWSIKCFETGMWISFSRHSPNWPVQYFRILTRQVRKRFALKIVFTVYRTHRIWRMLNFTKEEVSE